jgi:hypothetical protein
VFGIHPGPDPHVAISDAGDDNQGILLLSASDPFINQPVSRDNSANARSGGISTPAVPKQGSRLVLKVVIERHLPKTQLDGAAIHDLKRIGFSRVTKRSIDGTVAPSSKAS